MAKPKTEDSLKNLGRGERGRWKKGESGNPATMWEKGNSGNPAGKPPAEFCVTSRLKEKMGEPCTIKGANGKLWIDVLPDRMLLLACNGNAAAIREVFERLEGKVRQPIELSGEIEVVASPRERIEIELASIAARSGTDPDTQ